MILTPVAPGALLSGTPSLASDKKPAPDKLHEAAEQFEALMINEMLKSVREASSSGWLSSDDGSDAGQGSATEMAEAQFANALARSGGLGLSKMIETSVGAQGPTT